MKKSRVGVFVYGDIGRSPRMQNHAQQLSVNHQVYFMGYIDSKPRSTIVENNNIHLIDLQIKSLSKIKIISFYLYAIVRIIVQILQIVYLLGIKYRNLDFILVQNPPSIPNLFAIWLTSFLASYKIYIDFHNFGYTLLSLKIKNKIVNKLAQKYQKFFAPKHSRSFCVSNAMKQDLKTNWGIQSTTLYDRPLKNFINSKLQQNKQQQKNIWKKYNISLPNNNQLLIISSTSWTKDQNFSILLNAIQLYDKSENQRILKAFITGKGPEKQYYLQQIKTKQKNWKKVSIETVWLDADDYPLLLSLCHLGVCLHYSSSGLDLPMKVVDMFGAGIPVLAVQYQCIGELVKNGENGYTFKNSEQLCSRLIELSQNAETLMKLKTGAEKEKLVTWDVEWNEKFYLK